MKGHFGICFLLFVCAEKGNAISPVSKIAWINDKYGDDHVIDVDIERRPYMLFAQDDVMSAVPRQEAILWPGGVIPYEFDNFYIRKYKRKIESAMRMWESKTCIRFKKRTKESYFLRIYHGHGCKAEVGYFPGISTVSLGRRCNELSIILHELGHVIGFWHEQNRPDRDRYVQIIWRNINRGYQHAFRKYSSHQINSHATNYDFYSVMHYGMRSFTKNGGLTIRPRDPTVKRLGGTRLSEMDIQETNLMYKCDKRWKLRRTRFFHFLANSKDGRWSNWSPWKLCSRHCGGGTQNRLRSCSHVTSRGSRWCSGSAVQSRACNTHRCPDWPRWPSDFKFGVYQVAPKGSYCARIYERRQYFQWINYRLCWSSSGRKLNLRWSDSGAIRAMRCTHITEEREKKSHGWNDNFLCLESNTPYKFTWSSSGPIRGLQCLQWRAKEGFDGWNNNFLCAPPYPGKSLIAHKI